jgi:TolB protein
MCLGQESEPKTFQITLPARDGNQFGLLTLSTDGQTGSLETRGKMPLVEPAWSPDGKKLAFVSFENGPGQICVMDVESRQVRD